MNECQCMQSILWEQMSLPLAFDLFLSDGWKEFFPSIEMIGIVSCGSEVCC